MAKEKFYITTALPYVNDVPHLGHAYELIVADTIARHKRMKGHEVYFLTGTDEHGKKVELAALNKGIPVKEFVDSLVNKFIELWKRLNISYTDFIRTTEKRHIKGVETLFEKLVAKGDIYIGKYEGWYCTPCESFFPETQLGDNYLCPNCKRPVEKVCEESYFFAMSKYKDQWLNFVKQYPERLQPETRRNEMLKFVEKELRDLSISRSKNKLSWGIPIPKDTLEPRLRASNEYVFYVWFDALTNYISAIGYGYDEEKFRKWWPADLHLVGKDIFKFHTIIWFILLMAVELELPKLVFAHGWWTIRGEKMSKSKQLVVDPNQLINKYGVDSLRYFLLREIPLGEDGNFSEEALSIRLNSELANDLGNLLYRTLSMTEKYFNGSIPNKAQISTGLDEQLINQSLTLANEVIQLYDELKISQALERVWNLIRFGNKYIDESAPWTFYKTGNLKRCANILYNILETLRIIGILIYPAIPESANRIWYELGIDAKIENYTYPEILRWGIIKSGNTIRRGVPLFPRVGQK